MIIFVTEILAYTNNTDIFRVVELDKKKTTQLKDRGNVKADSDSSEDSSDEEFAPVIWRTKNSLI